MAEEQASLALAPYLDDAGTDYEHYKIRLHKWCRVCKHPKSKQAELIQLRMSKKPFGITMRIPPEILASENGVKELIKKLDEHYIPDKLQHMMSVWDKFMSIKRNPNEPIIDHITKYNDAFENFQDIDPSLKCPDTIVAMLLLTSCNLSDEDKKIVKAQMEEPPNSKNLIAILKRVMTGDKTARESNAEIEAPDTLIANNLSGLHLSEREGAPSATFYTRDNRRRYHPLSRDRYEYGRSYERDHRPERYERRRSSPERYERRRWGPYERDTRYDRDTRGDSSVRDRKRNPCGNDGQRKKCLVCKSENHYVKDCPDVKTSREEYEKKNNDNKLHEKDHEVHLSW